MFSFLSYCPHDSTLNIECIRQSMVEIRHFCISNYKFSEHDTDIICILLLDYLYTNAISQGQLLNSVYIRIELSRLVRVIYGMYASDLNRGLQEVASLMTKSMDELASELRQIAQTTFKGFSESMEELFKTVEDSNKKDTSKQKRGKKGKSIKNWQKNKFYQ